MKNLVTIKTAPFASELAVAKSYLESEGIESIIIGELSSQVYTTIAYSAGGVQLQVHSEDFEKSVSLLIEAGLAKKEDYEISETDKWLVKWVEKIQNFFRPKSKI